MHGTVRIAAHDYFYAAEPDVQGHTLVLLRSRSVTGSQWKPFVYALSIAAFIGAALAAVAAWLLARRIARPIWRVADASRSLARGLHPDPVPVEGAAELATLAPRSTTSPSSWRAHARRNVRSCCPSATS